MAVLQRFPGPRGGWLLGSLPALRRDILGFFETCHRDFGDAAYFRVGRRRSMLLSDPAAVETLRGLLADHDLSALDQFAAMRSTLGTMLGAERRDGLQAALDDLEFDRALGLLVGC